MELSSAIRIENLRAEADADADAEAVAAADGVRGSSSESARDKPAGGGSMAARRAATRLTATPSGASASEIAGGALEGTYGNENQNTLPLAPSAREW
jgi:hypothetical protein